MLQRYVACHAGVCSFYLKKILGLRSAFSSSNLAHCCGTLATVWCASGRCALWTAPRCWARSARQFAVTGR